MRNDMVDQILKNLKEAQDMAKSEFNIENILQPGIIKELTNMDYRFFSSQCYANGDKDCSMRLIADLD